MTECFADGTHEVKNIEEFENELNEMRRIVEEFDFEALFSEEY